IDNQLRGRSGRQGDPGAGKFYLSLEDDLMRIFGSDRIKTIMERFGMEEGQEIEHALVTRAIGTAQKRVEMQNFEIRQHLLKYDNVMNQQREMIYARRRNLIQSEDAEGEIIDSIKSLIEQWVENYDVEGFIDELPRKMFMTLFIPVKREDLEHLSREELAERLFEMAQEQYRRRKKAVGGGGDRLRQIERMIVLRVIDMNWKDYLFSIDQLREGINWRAYGQMDPLIEYQREAFRMFKDLIETIDREVVEHIFKGFVIEEQAVRQVFNIDKSRMVHEEFSSLAHGPLEMENPPAPEERETLPIETIKRISPKVGRNEPCPCGSGKKYKKCCGM
ncbi:MAG: SEC-C metal-binding domain-containing protein, partial [Candidatus Omnitrophica bacterium]|nr:SEC-C metal-binding domain-containing protein [Candidatus Omnitrophota bacterium]